MIRKMFAIVMLALAGAAFSSPPQVSNVTLIQEEFKRTVRVSYETSEPGIATCCFLENGEPVGEPGEVSALYGPINQYLDAGTHEFIWNAGHDLPDQFFESLTVEIKLWATNNPPEYCTVHLEGGAQYPVYWYGAAREVPFGVTNNLYKTSHLLMRKIPSTSGAYVFLGSSADGPEKTDRDGDNEEQRQVWITAPFYLGVYQVTQKQYTLIGAAHKSFEFPDDMHPANNASFNDIRGAYGSGYNWPNDGHAVLPTSFMGRLRAKTGGLLRFDLPTEAQWEYACRAGTTGPYNNGDDLDALGWHSGNSGGQYHVVGEKLPNSWGLYDMHGNIGELCLDWFSTTTPEALPFMSGADPKGPTAGSVSARARRGGGYNATAAANRAAARSYSGSSSQSGSAGLRVSAPAALLAAP